MVDEKLIKKIIVEYILLEKMMDGKICGANHRSLPVNGYHVESIVKRIIDYVDEIPSELFSTNEQIRIRDIKQALKTDLLCQDKEEVQRQLKASIDEIINNLKSRLSI